MDWKTKESKELFEAILQLQNVEEAQNFFRDLLTDQEIIEFANRLKAASMLHQGSSYVDVQETTGMSSTTVARIAKWLNKGMSGYKTILDRVHHHADSSSEKSPA